VQRRVIAYEKDCPNGFGFIVVVLFVFDPRIAGMVKEKRRVIQYGFLFYLDVFLVFVAIPTLILSNVCQWGSTSRANWC